MEENNIGIEEFCRLSLQSSNLPRVSLFENQAAQLLESIKIIVDDPAPDTTPQTFRCSECLDEFTNDADYRQHKGTHEKCKCPICHNMVSVAELKEHNETHISGYFADCGETQSYSLDRHIWQYHFNPKIFCRKCKKTFDNKEMLALHEQREHTGEDSFVCDQCGRKNSTVAFSYKHTGIKYGRRTSFSCNHCGMSFVGKPKREFEEFIVLAQPDVRKSCGKSFKIKRNINLPKKIMHKWAEEENPLCGICQKRFRNKLVLKLHLVVHGIK